MFGWQGSVDHFGKQNSLDLLKRAGMRPTQQRLLLTSVLFGESRHVSADSLYWELVEAGCKLPLATIYNTLNTLAEAGLLRKLVVNSGKVYFDTDTGDHQHFFIESEDRVIDIPAGELVISVLPLAPEGYEIAHVDILVRLKPKSASSAPRLRLKDIKRGKQAREE